MGLSVQGQLSDRWPAVAVCMCTHWTGQQLQAVYTWVIRLAAWGRQGPLLCRGSRMEPTTMDRRQGQTEGPGAAGPTPDPQV